MNFAQNQSLKIFIFTIIILIISIILFYNLYFESVLANQLVDSKYLVNEISSSVEKIFLEKIKTIKAISTAPIIQSSLTNSNKYYKNLSNSQRDQYIQQLNDKWKVTDQNDPFILEYTNNNISKYLKDLQQNIKGEFGEIFITNKYGALLASTSKLTTLAHGNKYWWQGSYNDGEGLVFLDDRGYDDSVGGYVLGVVIPIINGNEIIGILKANLNILGSISSILNHSQMPDHSKLMIIRNCGLIITDGENEPLSKSISSELSKRVRNEKVSSFTYKEDGDEWIIGASEIKTTSNSKGIKFGGTCNSIDHQKGNYIETWYVIDFNPIANVTTPAKNIINSLWIVGFLLSVFIAVTSLFIGRRAAKPIKILIKQAKKISEGNFDSKIIIKRNDEIGLLANSFNSMTTNLKETTTTLDVLNNEISERKQVEESLKESQKRFKQLFEDSPVPLFEEDYTSLITYLNKLKDEGIKDFRRYFDENPSEVELCTHKIKITNANKMALLMNNVDSKQDVINNISNTFNKTTLEKFKRQLTELAAGKTEFEAETEILTLNAGIKKVSLKLRVNRDENDSIDYSRCLVALLDTTERRKAETEIRQLSIAVQQSPSVIAITDIGGNLEYVNPKFTELTGYSIEEAIGLNPRVLKSGTQPDAIYEELWKTISSGDIWRGEFHNKKKNGDLFWEAASISPITDKDGKITSYIKIAEDISERKIAEQELLDTTIQLEKSYEKSEKHRVANLIMLNDLNNTTKNLKSEIKEREHIQINLEERERTYRTLINNLPGFAYRCNNDKEWTMNFISSGCLDVTGYAPEDFINNKNVSFNNIIHKKDQQRIWDKWQPIIRDHTIFEDEYTITTKNNQTRWVWERGCGIYSDEGELLFLEGFITDITDRKNAALALIDSENLSSAILEGSPIGISVRDKNGTLINNNNSWKNIWGFSDKDIAKRMEKIDNSQLNKIDSYLNEHRQKVKDIYKHGGNYFVPEIELKTNKKNKAKWITQQFYSIMGIDNKVERVVILTTDITDRKKAEEKIIRSEEKHRKLIQTAAEGFWLIDSKSTTINVNESLCEMIGYSKEELMGKTPYDFCNKENQLIFKEQIGKSKSLKHRTYEIELIKKNGDKVPTLFNATTMFDSKMKKTGSFAFVTDITKRKESEEEIKRNLREKDTLLRELYHRTKNNMQVISSMLRMQTRSIDSKTVGSNLDNVFLHDSFEEVINKIKAMSLVHQKLYQAKDLSHINLKEYINDLIKLLMISFGIRSEKISLKLEMEDIFVLIDTAIPLGLVLNELISNMFKHAFPNNDNDEVFIKLFKTEDETINIHLNDNGKGVPANLDLEKVNTMGLQTVYTLVVHQLRGKASYISDKGLKWQIKFKDNLHHERV